MAMRATPSIKAAAMIMFIRTLLDSDGCRAMASMADPPMRPIPMPAPKTAIPAPIAAPNLVRPIPPIACNQMDNNIMFLFLRVILDFLIVLFNSLL